MTFTTSSDEIVRKKTVGVFLLFTVLPLFSLFLSSDKWIWHLGFFLFFMLILLYTYLHRPTQYLVDNDNIIIRRPIGNIEISISDINRLERIHHDLLKTATKGGAFGYCGNFDTALGRIKFYATRRDRLVMLVKKDKTKIILTPDQEDEFIQCVETKASSQQGVWQNAG
jgi:cell division protein FtsW (lipid II flippase)